MLSHGMARNWTDGLSKVARCRAVETAVHQYTQPELDALRHVYYMCLLVLRLNITVTDLTLRWLAYWRNIICLQVDLFSSTFSFAFLVHYFVDPVFRRLCFHCWCGLLGTRVARVTKGTGSSKRLTVCFPSLQWHLLRFVWTSWIKLKMYFSVLLWIFSKEFLWFCLVY